MGLRSTRRTGSRAALASATVLGLLLGLSTPARAAGKPVNPTDRQLAAAQASKQQAAQQLGSVTAQLVLLKGQLDRAAADTDAAIAAYDATNAALADAVADVATANQAVDTARTTVAQARHQIADYVFSSYVYGHQPSITALLSSTDPNSALEAMAYQRYLGTAQQQHLATAQTNTVALSNAEAGRKRALQRAERLQQQAEDEKNRAMAKLAAFRQQQADFNRRRAQLTAQTAAAARRLATLTNQRRAFERWQAEERARQAAERARQAAERARQAAEWARQQALRQQQQQHASVSLPSAAPPSGDQPWTLPLPAGSFYMTTCFCMRWGEFHTGDDLAAGYGTPIYAIGSGRVVAAGPASGFGNWVVIDHGNGFTSIYGHMKVLAVSTGQYVSVGQKIAYVGSEGQSTGPHLHLEIRIGGMFGPRVDPQVFLARRGISI